MPVVPFTPRATRYVLECSLDFRLARKEPWHSGRLKNISESGLLFDAGTPVAPGSRMDVRIPLPPPGTGTIRCTAVVVRDEANGVTVAGRIERYRLGPSGE